MLRAVLGGDPLRVTGTDYDTPDGTCIRDYVHVDDLAAGHSSALEYTASGENGHTSCNLGSGGGFSNLDVLHAAETVVGHSIKYEFGPRRAGDPPVLVASNERAQEVLGWQPQRGIEDMIRSAWTWRQEHPNGYESP